MQDFNPNTRLERNAEKFEIPVSRFSRLVRTMTTPSGDTLRGLDLSHWNANDKIDFKALKANGIDFVILKVTEGTSFVDDTFKTKAELALEADLIVMPYHFFRGNSGGATQANHCVNTLRSLGFLDLIEYVTIIWADVESSDGVSVTQRKNRLLAFLQTVESLGFQGGVYSSPYYWNSLIGLVGWINNYWQWVAHWSSVSVPTLPNGWTRLKTIVWQNGIHPAHSWVETVIGAVGNVDHNYFYGTIERLKEILKFPVVPPTNGDCNCEEQITFLTNELARVETEMNNNKLEIYNLQQGYYGVTNEIKNLHDKDIAHSGYIDDLNDNLNELADTNYAWQVANVRNLDELDNRVSALEALVSQLKNIFCQ